MKKTYFKGLQKALMEGCYVKVFRSAASMVTARVEKKCGNMQPELIVYSENGSTLSVLNSASNQIINELLEIADFNGFMLFHQTLLDRFISQGYSLHFYKLSNNQILTSLCTGSRGNYIPLKSIITDDIEDGFETLNASLVLFNEELNLHDWASSHVAPVYEHQKTIIKNKDYKNK